MAREFGSAPALSWSYKMVTSPLVIPPILKILTWQGYMGPIRPLEKQQRVVIKRFKNLKLSGGPR